MRYGERQPILNTRPADVLGSVLKMVFVELDVIQEDDRVGCKAPSDLTRPGQEVRLVDHPDSHCSYAYQRVGNLMTLNLLS